MKLTPPKQSTWWISVVLFVVGLLGFFVSALAGFQVWLFLVAYVVLAAGLMLKGF